MKNLRQQFRLDQAADYTVQVQGVISEHWLDYFEGLQITVEGQDGWAITTLTGRFVDQAVLQGLLQQLYSLGLILLKVERKEN
jgi:hypothetical protein